MSHVIRQELSGTVKALAEHLKIADQYIDHIKSKPSPEDETQLAITIEMELVHLNQRVEQLQTVINKFNQFLTIPASINRTKK